MKNKKLEKENKNLVIKLQEMNQIIKSKNSIQLNSPESCDRKYGTNNKNEIKGIKGGKWGFDGVRNEIEINWVRGLIESKK